MIKQEKFVYMKNHVFKCKHNTLRKTCGGSYLCAKKLKIC